MKKKVQWPRRIWVKALAWILGIAACFMAVVGGTAVAYALEGGYYADPGSNFYDSLACRDLVQYRYAALAYDWYGNVVQAKAEGLEQPVYENHDDPNGIRFQFVLTDGKTGEQLASNRDDSKANYVGQLCFFQSDAYWMNGDVWVKSEERQLVSQADLADYVPEAGNYYLMDCYLVQPAAGMEYGDTTGLTVGVQLYAVRYEVLALFAGGLALGLACFILLLCGAGRWPGDEQVHLCWYDRIPMELSLAATAGLDWMFALLCCWFLPFVMRVQLDGPTSLAALLEVAAAAACFIIPAALLTVAWVLGFARWAKTGHAFQNFLGIRLLGFIGRGCKKLPVAPKTALIVGAIAVSNLFAYLVFYNEGYYSSRALLSMLLFGGVMWAAVWTLCIYIAANLRTLQNAGRRMAAGDYVTPVDTRGMLPVFCDYAATLGNIRAGVNTAVEQRMKSERLKTELITNVSHDLKTPLTSIINYTDLLQREPLPEKAAEYAAVLARQGEKLKKLTEDLVEASKASAGALPCSPVPTDLAELVEQALAEYEEKMAAAALTPVVTMPEGGLYAMADGRLAWRVLDNLLNNACKYALPGTRLYIDGAAQGAYAALSVKNISREPLNVTADELMERFVRGDAARTSEGSGLGLSIARSLTELQGGTFRLSVDGDLFKAELRFAAAVPPAPAAAAPAQGDAREQNAQPAPGAEQILQTP